MTAEQHYMATLFVMVCAVALAFWLGRRSREGEIEGADRISERSFRYPPTARVLPPAPKLRRDKHGRFLPRCK